MELTVHLFQRFFKSIFTSLLNWSKSLFIWHTRERMKFLFLFQMTAEEFEFKTKVFEKQIVGTVPNKNLIGFSELTTYLLTKKRQIIEFFFVLRKWYNYICT